MLLCVCVILAPSALILVAVAQEAAGFYHWISRHEIDLASVLAGIRSAAPPFVVAAFDFIKLGTVEELQDGFNLVLGQATQWVAPEALDIGQGAVQLVVSAGVMLYVLFFLFRDDTALSSTIRRSSPLTPHQTEMFLGKLSEVLLATVKGNVVIALIQGAIGGIVFWFLGINGALLWGVVMALLSLLPIVGATIIWLPVSTYLLLSGQTSKGLTLMIAGVFLIGLIDNLLRPLLVGKDTRMPEYLILVSTLGGIALLGINGFIIGPLIAATFISVWPLQFK